MIEPTAHTADQRRVIDRFLVDGRLVSIPAKAAKRRLVLEDLAHSFEPGVIYTEAQVTEILSSFHDDHCALRRYLVDECLLDRRDARYWRFDRTTASLVD